MPTGVGAVTLQGIPSEPWVLNPDYFFERTEGQVLTPITSADPGEGKRFTERLLQTGIVSKFRLVFVGSLVVTSGGTTSAIDWPYGLLDGFELSANGATDLFSCDGLDLHALRFVRYPAFDEEVDQFPGTVGGGDSIAEGTYPLHLTFEIPIAMDDTTLIGSLYAQSAATNLTYRVARALNTRLFSANETRCTITGTWFMQETLWEIPRDDKGNLVVPDVTKLHGFVAQDYPFTQTGDVRTLLMRTAGQLARLFVSGKSADQNRLSALPSAASTKKIDRVVLTYGGNKKPLEYDPASTLLSINNQHYGAPAPYDRLVLDRVRENPPRDAILMQGVTELALIVDVDSGVTVTEGNIRFAQETLYS